MEKGPFKSPEEYDAESTEQVCARVRKSTKEALEKAAAKRGKKAAWLAGQVLDDYAAFLKSKKK